MRRLPTLFAVVAALLSIPVAHAAAAEITFKGEGSGKGTIASAGLEVLEGNPHVSCSYTSPGPATGSCKTETEECCGGFKGVLVQVTAASGSEFAGWTSMAGIAEECGTNCYLVSPGASDATAVFCTTGTAQAWGEPCKEVEVANHVTVIKEGEGTVVATPPGIECGLATSICLFELSELNSTVTLTASPAAGYAFSAWGGCLTHEGLTCTVLMDKSKTVKIAFVPTPLLTVEKAGSGYGKVAATGISCDESCSKSTAGIKTGTAVTVKAIPAKGYEFAGFEGGTGNASPCAATCAFAISEKSSVKVKFSPIPTKTLTVALTGPGAYKGKVTSKGTTVKGLVTNVISCGSGCATETESFFATGETELLATPAPGYTFAGWTVSGGSAGTCTGTTTPCRLLTDADKTVEAEFE